MKKVLILAFLFGSAFSVCAQLVLSSSSQIIIGNGSTLVLNTVVNNSGTIDNSGTVEIQGNLENNTSGLMASTSLGTLKFNGSSAQEITGDADANFYGPIEIDNTSGVSIKTGSTGHSQTINGTLTFTNGLFTLNEFNLTLITDATGSAVGNYVQTNSTGVVKRIVGSSNILFPVGNSTYNPVTLNNTGTSDTYNVRVVDAEPAGSSTDHMVNRSWVISEDVPNGGDVTITPQWISGEELTNFDNANCSVGLTTNSGADYIWTETGSALGSNPYTKSGTSFTTVGTFAVGDYFYSGKRLDIKIFLAGAYNGTNMNQDLYTAGLIPAVDPYGISLESTSIPSTAVDWVKVELRDQTTPATILHSYAFFVDVNGNLLDRDGNTGAKIIGATISTPYNVAVVHRNHFGIMTAANLDLDVVSPSYDFTTAQSQAWDNTSITTNDAMKDLGSGIYGLWVGDANGDGQVQYASGANSDQVTILNAVGSTTPGNIVLNTYTDNDVNLDGDVQYASGANSDQVTILNVVGSTTPGNILSAHLPE